jgi:hypothetical protein
MSKVLIPNIIITRDYDAMIAIFSGDKYIDSSKLKSDNKLFFLSANKNKYLTSFEYDLEFAAKKEKFFKINFIDSDGNFESEFLESSFLSEFTLHVAEQLSTIKDIVDSVTGDSSLAGYYYIAFGIGEELSNWSEPHVCQFRGAQIQIDANGRRIYSFNFTPSNDPIFRRQFMYDTKSINYQGDFLYLDKLKYILNVSHETDPTLKETPYVRSGEMIRSLLIKYLQAACNSKNILVLLPEIDREVKNIRNLNYPGVFKEDFFSYKDIYSKIFGLELTMNTGVPESIASFRKKTENYLKKLDFATKIRAYQNQINSYNTQIKNLQVNITDLQEKIDDFYARRLAFLRNELQKLAGQTFDNPNVRTLFNNIRLTETEVENTKTQIKSYQANIDNLNEKISSLQYEIDSIVNKHNKNGKGLLAALLIDSTKKLTKLNIPTIDYLKEYSEQLLKNLDSIKSYILTFQGHFSRKSSVTPNTFDWYQCLNRVFDGIATTVGLDKEDSIPYLYEETDIKLINLWYKNGIIPNNKDRCIVLGVKSLVNNYLYRNSSVFDRQMTTESTLEFNPKYKLEDSDLLNKLTKSNYPKELFELISRKKNSSAFSESIILDELAVNSSKFLSNQFLKFLGNSNILKLSDTPIFMNNLKNSNIRSIDVNNLQSYFSFMNFNVKTDYIDDLILNAKSLYKKSSVYKATNKEFEDLIIEVVKKRQELEKLKPQQAYVNPLVAALAREPGGPAPTPVIVGNAVTPLSYLNDFIFGNLKDKVSPEVIETSKKLLSKMEERKNNEDPKNSYKFIFSILSKEVLQVLASEKTIDNDEKITTDIENLSLLVEALFTIGKIKMSGDKPILTLADRNGLPSEKNIKAALFQYLYATSTPTITIRTLPFFHLSNNRTIIGKTAILLSKRTTSQVSPINPQLQNLENSLDFFSGVYNIIGAKHIITTSDCYSEFVIQKLIAETIN